MTSQKCDICLKLGENLRSINDFDDNNIKILFKLQSIVPEMEWFENYEICKKCYKSIEEAHSFRMLCISLESERRSKAKDEIKTEVPLFNCFHCNKGFSNKEILSDHIQDNHISILGLAHVISNKRVHKQEPKNKSTKKSRSSSRIFSCEICDIKMNYAKLIIEHCVKEHSMDAKLVKPFTCDECPMRFTSSANIIQHKKYHEGARTHICSFCGKSYITKSDLTVHEYTHYNRRNYKCEFCEKAFNTNKNLRSHILVVHTSASLWKYECAVCSKRFPLKSGYEQHMRRHNGDKRFVCHICEKPFVSRSEVQKHLGYHSKARPYKCGYCEKLYKERRFYEIHLAKEHGIGDAKIPFREKKFSCHICTSSFCDKVKFTRHLLTHSGVKPFQCEHCEKKFSDKYYFKRHLRSVHNIDEGSGDLDNSDKQ